MREWNGTAEAYDRSFATLCEGAVQRMLTDLPVQSTIRAVFEARTGALVGDDGLLRFPVRAAYVLAASVGGGEHGEGPQD